MEGQRNYENKTGNGKPTENMKPTKQKLDIGTRRDRIIQPVIHTCVLKSGSTQEEIQRNGSEVPD